MGEQDWFASNAPQPDWFSQNAHAAPPPSAGDILSGRVGRETNLSDAPDQQPSELTQLNESLQGAAHPRGISDFLPLLIQGGAPTMTGREFAGRAWQAAKAAAAETSSAGKMLTLPGRMIGKFYDALPSSSERAIEKFLPEGVPQVSQPPTIQTPAEDIFDRVKAERQAEAAAKPTPAASGARPPQPAGSALSDADRAQLVRQGYPPDVIDRIEGQLRPVPAHEPVAPRATTGAQPGDNPLMQPRIDTGAERAGRAQGLSKEQVRAQTGPVLDEAAGDASPILPQKALNRIIDDMRALPPNGPERAAYVARATSGKTMAQVENIRRTLEHLGLIAPIGAAVPTLRDQLLQMMRTRSGSEAAGAPQEQM